MTIIKLRNSITSGNVPVSLAHGEIGLNEADSLLFYRGPSGAVTSFNLAGGGAPLASPVFTGDPKAPTPTAGDNDTSIATTAFVGTAITGKADTTTVNTALALKADLASPTFTGDPKAPTPTAGDNDTSIATTAFVTASIAGKADTSVLATYAPLASPTLTGDPKAPTPTAGDNDTSIATTAFVGTAITGKADTTTVNTALALKADLASPTFTGDPKAPTPSTSDNDTSVATTAFVQNVVAAGTAANNPACGILRYSSATALTFTPYNGDRIKINGAIYTIPAAGIAGASTGVYVNGVAGQNLVAATFYNVYLFNNSGTLTFDFSTTTHVASTTAGNVGVEIKSGDDTRTLIGIVYAGGTAPNVFYDQDTARLMRSWFNRSRQSSYAGFSASTASATPVLLAGGSNQVVSFNGDAVEILGPGYLMAGAITIGDFFIYIDGAQLGTVVRGSIAAANLPNATTNMQSTLLSEGLHNFNAYGSSINGVSITFSGNLNVLVG